MAVTVPDLRSYTVEQATAAAKRRGLNIRVVGNGAYVTSQTPQGGTKVEKENGLVVVYTGDSKAQQSVKVPDLSGMSAMAANQMLINSGLNIRIDGTQNYLSGTGAAVVSQSPAAGEIVSPGTVVNVTIRYLNEQDLE